MGKSVIYGSILIRAKPKRGTSWEAEKRKLERAIAERFKDYPDKEVKVERVHVVKAEWSSGDPK